MQQTSFVTKWLERAMSAFQIKYVLSHFCCFLELLFVVVGRPGKIPVGIEFCQVWFFFFYILLHQHTYIFILGKLFSFKVTCAQRNTRFVLYPKQMKCPVSILSSLFLKRIPVHSDLKLLGVSFQSTYMQNMVIKIESSQSKFFVEI